MLQIEGNDFSGSHKMITPVTNHIIALARRISRHHSVNVVYIGKLSKNFPVSVGL